MCLLGQALGGGGRRGGLMSGAGGIAIGGLTGTRCWGREGRRGRRPSVPPSFLQLARPPTTAAAACGIARPPHDCGMAGRVLFGFAAIAAARGL